MVHLRCGKQYCLRLTASRGWIIALVRVPTVMENPGKKLSWKVMENLLVIESHEISLRAGNFF